jgi:dsRNA-specific ribonuclease
MPTYSEVSKSGLALPNANDKKFQILCEAFGCRAIGEGANKKTAKHQAAEKVLKRLMKRNLSNYVDDDDDEDDLDTSSDSIASDFVSQLLDYCVPRNFPKPEFELVKQYGPPHAPTFVLQCKVSSVTTSCKLILN